MLIAALAAGLLLAQAAQPAAPTPPAGEPTTVSEIKAKPKRQKLICEEEKSADSFIARRVCRTPEEVEALRRTAREQTKATQDFYQECTGRSC
jgi:hypothetical protein